MYLGDTFYEINHLVFPIVQNKDKVLVYATKAHDELLSAKTFGYISNNYDVSDDTKNNSGYLGKLNLSDLPNIIKSNISNMKDGEIKMITSESNAIHIFQLVNTQPPINKAYDEVKDDIEIELKTKKGSQKYFSILDSIKQKIYGKNISLSEIAQTYDLELFRTSRIDQTYYDNILSSPTVKQLIQ